MLIAIKDDTCVFFCFVFLLSASTVMTGVASHFCSQKQMDQKSHASCVKRNANVTNVAEALAV